MKYLIFVLGIVIIGGGYWLISSSEDAAVTTDTAPTREEAEMTEPDVFETTYEIDPADFLDKSIVADTTEAELSEAEIAGLLLMREEEKLARDVYEALGEQWNMQIFSNIARSEQTHMDTMKDLLALYAIADPVVGDTRGVFTDANLQALYDSLVAQGQTSLEEALVVGATIEELDIKDLADLMEQTNNEQILTVYRNLQKGSRNHLRAFDNQMQRRNVDFVPQYITQAEYTAIVNAPQERGQL